VVSAALAALRAYRPTLSASDAERILMDTANASAAGRTLNVAAAFRAAGLRAIVDAYSPPRAEAPTSAYREPVPAPRTLAQVQVVIHDRAADPSQRPAERLERPVLRRVTFRKRVLRVELRQPPNGVRACFRIDGRAYHRSTGTLLVRVRGWRQIMVFYEGVRGSRSPQLRIQRRAIRSALTHSTAERTER
jgi:hypothetical protein